MESSVGELDGLGTHIFTFISSVAEEYLSFAYQNCHRRCRRNLRLILTYLIPVKMLLGHLPHQDLLEKHDLTQFSDVVKAVRYVCQTRCRSRYIRH